MKELNDINKNLEPLNEDKVKIKKGKYPLLRLLPLLFCVLSGTLSIILIIAYLLKSSEYTRLEKKVMDNIFSPYHSDLIPDMDTLRVLKNFVKDTYLTIQNRTVVPTLRMYYKSSIDGDYCDDFHSKTDGWKSILVLIKDEEGNIFGGTLIFLFNDLFSALNSSICQRA